MPTITDNIRSLAEEQKRAWETEGKPLADIAAEREFTPDEREKFERLELAYNSFDDRITALRHQKEIEERALSFADDLVGSQRQNGPSLQTRSAACCAASRSSTTTPRPRSRFARRRWLGRSTAP